MRVMFIGSGGAFSRRFGHTNALIEEGSTRIMLDFGHQTPIRMEQTGQSMNSITHVLVSHIHADHVGGLEELALMSRFVYGKRPVLALPPGLRVTLWDHSLRGGLEWTSDQKGNQQRCDLESYFDVLDLELDWHPIGELFVMPFRVEHVPGKCAYGFSVKDRDGHVATFSCDSRRVLAPLLETPIPPPFDTGPVFHDCQCAPSDASSVHTSLESLLGLPESIRSRLFLTHYGDDLDNFFPRIKSAGIRWVRPGETMDIARLF